VAISELVESLRNEIDDILEHGERINANLQGRYWYPLSVATYGTEEILEALTSLCSFRTTMWEKTQQFEKEFGDRFGGEAVMVNSGSSADLLIAFALHELSGGPLKSGDEILAPSVTWPTQLWSLLMAGYKVRLVDVDPDTLNVDLDDLEAKIGPNTRGISLVHLMGNPVDMDKVLDICNRHGLILFEDCCESLGASWDGKLIGTFGIASAYSFFFSHHMTTMEGGMILTRDPEFAERLRLLRAHGWSRNLRNPAPPSEGLDSRYTFESWGFNVRPTELQAGFGLVQLGRFDGFQENRRNNAVDFQSRISKHEQYFKLMTVAEKGECSWFALPITISPSAPFTRGEFAAYLENHGVETRPIVAGNLAKHPAASKFPDLLVENLPGADHLHDHGLYIGLHPVDSASDLEKLCQLIDDFIDANLKAK